MRDLLLRAARHSHRAGSWIFDRSGPAAPALARLGEPLHRRLFPQSLLSDPDVPIEVDGLLLYHEGRSSYHMQILALGSHDRDVADALRQVARARMNIVDVGAHIGSFSLAAARLVWPGGCVWAFEPHPRLAAILRRNVTANGLESTVDVAECAVGDVVGDARLYAGADDSMLSSLHRPASGTSEADGGKAVACTTLDAWGRGRGWPRVDVAKIDVEGHEVAVLRGMRELARRNAGLVALMEFNERTLQAAGETAATFAAALDACGLSRIEIAGRSPRPVAILRDLAFIRREVARSGNERVNLVCRAPER